MRWISVLLLYCMVSTAGGQASNSDLSKAEQLLANGDYDAALANLNQIAAHSSPAGLNRDFGVAYYQKADYLKAVPYLTQAVKENPNDFESVRFLGLADYMSGNPEAAIPYLKRVQGQSEGETADFALGLCYATTRKYEPALELFSRLYGVPAGSPTSHMVFARILLLEGLDPAAEEQAKLALKQAPAMPLAHFVLGQVYLYRSDQAQAISEFKAELAINGGSSRTLMRLAEAELRAGRADDAEASLQRSLWLDGGNAEAYTLMGKVRLKKGEPASAVPALVHALEQEPNNYTAHYLLGQAYIQMGKMDLARQQMKIAAALQELPPAGAMQGRNPRGTSRAPMN